MQQLINKVNEAKAVLNVSQSKLSTMIGYSQNYISESISRNCSVQKRQDIIDLIDRVMAGEVIPSQDDVLDMLSEDVQELTESNERLVRDKIALKKRLADLTDDVRESKLISAKIKEYDDTISLINSHLEKEKEYSKSLYEKLADRNMQINNLNDNLNALDQYAEAIKKSLAQTGIELDKERNSAIHFKESFIQMQEKASQLNKELMTQKFNTNLYFFLALALGILLGVVWS